jgi:DNA polymerase III epsilon subunit-like protein
VNGTKPPQGGENAMFTPREPITIVDTETTGLRPVWHRNPRRPVEIGAVRVQPDGEVRRLWVFVAGLPIDHEDEHTAGALRLNGFYRRHPDATGVVPDGAAVLDPAAAMAAWCGFSAGSAVAGANVQFDVATLGALAYELGHMPAYSTHHLWDVAQSAGELLGLRGAPSQWRLSRLLEAAGLEVPPGARHTALGDAELTVRLAGWCAERAPELAAA